MDDLTPLDARNSLLLDRPDTEGKISTFSAFGRNSLNQDPVRPNSPDRYMAAEEGIRPPLAPPGGPLFRFLTPTPSHHGPSGSMDSTYNYGGHQQPHAVSTYGHTRASSSYGSGGGYRGF